MLQECDDEMEEESEDGTQKIFRIVRIPFTVITSPNELLAQHQKDAAERFLHLLLCTNHSLTNLTLLYIQLMILSCFCRSHLWQGI